MADDAALAGPRVTSRGATFESAQYVGRELGVGDLPALQALFDANPEYFERINGRRPRADEATIEYEELPPAEMHFRGRWFTGVFDRGGTLVGLANVLRDLLADGVWHIGLYLVATPLHGGGAAAEIYEALEGAMAAAGARWIRLGVVAGNERAERFWMRRGYREVKVRSGIDTGGRINDVRVLVKSSHGAPIADYFALVERDRPESLLP